MKNYYRVHEVADMLNVSPSSVRNYADQGRIKHTLTVSGQRVFKLEWVQDFMGQSPEKRIIGYVRSSSGQKASIETQKQLIQQAYPNCDIVCDTGSGLSERRRGLKKVIKLIREGEKNTIVVVHKDRLSRFGLSYLEELIQVYGGNIEYLQEQQDKNLQEELLQDFMTLLAVFSGKYYRLRGWEQQKALLQKAKEQLP